MSLPLLPSLVFPLSSSLPAECSAICSSVASAQPCRLSATGYYNSSLRSNPQLLWLFTCFALSPWSLLSPHPGWSTSQNSLQNSVSLRWLYSRVFSCSLDSISSLSFQLAGTARTAVLVGWMQAWITCQRASSSGMLIPAECILSLHSGSWPCLDWPGPLLQTQAPLNKLYQIPRRNYPMCRLGSPRGAGFQQIHSQDRCQPALQPSTLWDPQQPCCIPGSPSQHPCSWMTPSASGLGSGNLCRLLGSKVKVCWGPCTTLYEHLVSQVTSIGFRAGLYPQKSLCWGTPPNNALPPLPLSCPFFFPTSLVDCLLRAFHFAGG